jgi:DNA-binding MarR family transcriptional regulator
MTPPDPTRRVGLLIRDISQLMRAEFNRRMAPKGLTQAQWQALARLSFCEGVRQVQLAEMLEIAPITLTRQLDRLEEQGWVERRPDPEDRRAQRLFLTPEAQPMLQELWKEAAEVKELAMRGMPHEQREALIDALNVMKTNLSARQEQETEETRHAG